MPSGFRRKSVSYRSFYCELKYRPPGDDGTNEIFLEEFIVEVPRLKDSDMEKQWCFAICWGKLYSSEWEDRGVNQCFIFTAKYGEVLARLEKQEFFDEDMQRIKAPDQAQWCTWTERVRTRFKHVYGFDLVGF